MAKQYDPFEEVTEREITVVRLLSEGYREKEMVGELSLSCRTVEGVIAAIKKKFGCTTSSQLVAKFKDKQLI